MSGKSPVVVYGAVARCWTQATGLALFALGARRLGVAEFGIFAMAAVFINIVNNFLYSGLYEFVMRSRPEDGLDQTSLVLNLGVATTGATLSTAVGWIVARVAHQPDVFYLAATMAPSAFIACTAAWHEAQILRQHRYTFYYSNWIIGETVAATAGAVLLVMGGHLYSLVGYRYLQSTMSLAGYFFFARVPYFGRLRLFETPRILKFAGPIYGSRLLSGLSSYGVDLIVGLILGPAATGLYRLASRVVSSVSEAIFQPLRVLTWTRSSAARGSPLKISLKLLPLINVATLLLWPTAAILAYLSGDILRIGLGARWEPAAPIIAMLFLARSVEVAELFLEPLLASTGAGKRLLVVRCISIVVMVMAVIILARFGPSYVGGANLASAAVIAGAVFPTLMRRLGVMKVLRTMQDGAAAFVVCGLLMVAGQVFVGRGQSPLMTHIAVAATCGLLLLGLLAKRLPLVVALKR